MKAAAALHMLLLVQLAVASASAAANAKNPLSSVLELLDSLAAKITKEGEAEAKAFKEYMEWCEDTTTHMGFNIKTATSKKENLQAEIAKQADDATAAAGKIEELAGSIAADSADLKSATTIRKKEAADFTANEAELVEVIDTLGRAITVLEREMAKNPAALAQMDTSSVAGLVKSLGAVTDAAAFSSADKQRLVALVQAQQSGAADDGDELGAPDPAAYKTHSGNIVEVLEDLKEKAEEQLGALRKAETNAKHNYEMLKQSLEDQIAADTKDMDQEKAAKAAAEETKAAATGDLATTEKDLVDGNAALATAKATCMQTAADHDATVASRKEELEVIAKAKEILAASTSGAASQTYSLLQVDRSSAGVRSMLKTRTDLASAEIVTLVRRLAKEHHSAALAQLASQINAVIRYGASTGEDPFGKVKGLIADMIAKLEAQAQSEGTEKAYCDEQLAKTEAKKGELNFDISKLTSKIDKAAAASAGLKEEVKELQAELAALLKSQAEMDKMRQESHADYAQAKTDLEAGLLAVRKALQVLREYYASGASAASAAAMLQGGAWQGEAELQPAAPEKFEKAEGAGSSIIGMLEVVESDFAKNLAAEETAEADAAGEYEKLSQENRVTKTLKDQDVKYKTQEYKSLDKTLAELSSDREAADAELSAVLEYYEKIKSRCIAKAETYEERAKRREAEIAGLREALSILENEAAFVQRRKRGGHRGRFLGAAQP